MLAALFVACSARGQTTGTFMDRLAPTDLRVVSYNIYFDSVFTDTDPVRAAKFARVMTALNPDVVNLQEIYAHAPNHVVALMNSILPLGGGETWYAHQSDDNVIASKYPLSLQRTNTVPSHSRGIAIALVDLPDVQFTTDFYFMNNHYKCCGNPGGAEDANRQRQSDALVNWMRDVRTAGGSETLPAGTPMAVVGDLNIVGSLDPLDNLIAGNIVNEGTYGADSPPDWDGTSLADARPVHNGSGTVDYTWRNDNSGFAPGRLDFVLYTDHVARSAHQFVLNTVSMSAAELAATGLQTYDVTFDAQNYDHLPVVVDFRFVADGTPGDFNLDRVVDALDYELWRQSNGSGTYGDAGGNGNGVMDAADYVIWRKYTTSAATALAVNNATSVPEPTSILLCLTLCGTLAAAQSATRSARRFHTLRISAQGTAAL